MLSTIVWPVLGILRLQISIIPLKIAQRIANYEFIFLRYYADKLSFGNMKNIQL